MSIDVASDHVGNRYMTCAMSCSYSMHRQLTVIWIALMLPFAFGVSPNRGRSKCVNSSCLGSAARRSLASSIAARLPTSNTWQPTKISSRIVTPPSRTCRLSYSTCSSQLKPGSRLRAHLCGHTASMKGDCVLRGLAISPTKLEISRNFVAIAAQLRGTK